jgi:hypothetical protein
MRTGIFAFIFVVVSAAASSAGTLNEDVTLFAATPAHDPWHISWLSGNDDVKAVTPTRQLAGRSIVPAQTDTQATHAAAVEHSDAYLTRAKIHRIASWATLPLFASELALGASIYNGDSGWKKGAHAVVGGSIVGLFGLNTVTGAWNLFGESWNDPGRGKRLLHGLLMLASDAGFAATSMSTPSEHNGLTFTADRATHRNLAITSIGLGTTGYLIMLLGNH